MIAISTLSEGAALAAEPPAVIDMKRLAGRYDGGQTEIAALLELGADGRFRYALSYGALDEEARGRWEVAGSRVVLTSDPVAAPAFVLLSARPLPDDRLKVRLDLPQGMNRQYFNARARLADGRSIERPFAEEGLDAPLEPGERVVSVSIGLPIFGLESAPAALAGANGGEAHFRFEPNDLGKVGFERQGLAVEPDGLRLQRHDRTIRFRRTTDE
jgi:hypothetical protein